MSAVDQDEVVEVFERVGRWPEEARRSLFEMISETFRRGESIPEPKGTLNDLVGLLRFGDGPPPTEREMEDLLEEELLRKYGP